MCVFARIPAGTLCTKFLVFLLQKAMSIVPQQVEGKE